MRENILITGVAGFLGSHLADLLISKGHKVIGIDNLFRGRIENISHLFDNDSFIYIEKDLTKNSDMQYIQDALQKFKIGYMYHYAAINGTEHFYDKPNYTFSVNCKMTDNVLNLAHIHKSSLKKFIYASSSEIYGEPSILPTPESEKISLNIFADRDSYAASKVYGEFAVRLFCKENNMPYTILRPFNTYGSRMDNSKYGQVVPEFIRKLKDKNFTIIGDGDQTRSFCHVKDHVILVEKIMNSSKSINKIINIGNDKEITINHLAKTLHEISKKEFIPSYLPSRKYDVHRRCPNIDLLTSVTGKRPTVTLKQGLSELLASI